MTIPRPSALLQDLIEQSHSVERFTRQGAIDSFRDKSDQLTSEEREQFIRALLDGEHSDNRTACFRLIGYASLEMDAEIVTRLGTDPDSKTCFAIYSWLTNDQDKFRGHFWKDKDRPKIQEILTALIDRGGHEYLRAAAAQMHNILFGSLPNRDLQP